MRRGEDMAPTSDAQHEHNIQRWAEPSRSLALERRRDTTKTETSNDRRGRPAVRASQDSPKGSSASGSGKTPDSGKGSTSGSGKETKGKSVGDGSKGNANDSSSSDSNDTGNENDRTSNKGAGSKGSSDDSSRGKAVNNSGAGSKSGSSNTNSGKNGGNDVGGNGNSNSNSNNNGGNGNGNGNGGDSTRSSNNNNNSNNGNNGSGNGNGSAATTTAVGISSDAGSSDSNGAENFSSESFDSTASTTIPDTTTSATAAITQVAGTLTSAIATTEPDVLATGLLPSATSTADEDLDTSSLRGLGPFPTQSSGFPGRFNPDDRRHKNSTSKVTGSSNSNNSNNNKNSNNNNSNNKGSSNRGNNTSSKTLSPTAERALISVGSIGAFIVVCFIFWLVWRALRKQKRKEKKNTEKGNVSAFDTDDKPFAVLARLPGRICRPLVEKIPCFSRRRKAWQALEDTVDSNSGLGPTKDALAPDMFRGTIKGNDEKGSETMKTFGFTNDSPPTLPPQVYYSSGLGLQYQLQPQQYEVIGVNQVPITTMKSSSGVSTYTHSPAGSFSSSQISAASAMPLATTVTGTIPAMYGNSGAFIAQAISQPGSFVVLPSGQHIPAGDANSGTSTLRSRMPDPFYNQSEFARQPSDAYDPSRRLVNRTSELSSLSSGFGDGEILLPSTGQQQVVAGLAQPQQPSQPAYQFSRPPPQLSGPPPTLAGPRFSWLRNKRLSRETTYSESSEDQPARFRSVGSWVHQQTGRVRRAQASIDTTSDPSSEAGNVNGGGAPVRQGSEPGIPHPMPEDQRLTLMMDFEEEPRRPDIVPGIRTP